MSTKFVFDTNILISSTIWDGSVAQKLLYKLIEQNAVIFSSTEILAEYQEILKRDFDYSDKEVADIMEKVLQFITLINPRIKVNAVKEDVDDNKIIECALESKADYIISYDKHILNLKKYKEIKIVRPEEIIEIF